MSETVTDIAIGVDLGTTNSCVAYVNDQGQPEVIPNREGFRTTPSVYAITASQDTLVGKPAVDQEAENPGGTIRSVKRMMGRDGTITLGGTCEDGGLWERGLITATSVSASILGKLKADAEAALGKPVSRAVITVPAYFSSRQREATKEAGEIAGLQVLQVINEPTAAALAYGLGQNKNETVLVYDLGGGTFDVTVLRITDDGVFEVLSTSGDTHLGGDDFDNAIIQLVVDKYFGHGQGMHTYFPAGATGLADPKIGPLIMGVVKPVNLDAAQMARLRDAAEQAKKDLTASKSATINVPFFHFEGGNPIHLKGTVSRDEFETAIASLVERTHVCVKQAMDDAGLKASDIDEVVFVGGSTRVPMIFEKVSEWTWKTPNRSVNPDEAVALGAAVQAAILTGQRERDVLLLDVIPLTLGIETLGGVFTKMVNRNTTIPMDVTETFTTADDSQNKVEVRVYQGERPKVADNIFLGSFHLTDIPPAPRGVPQIDVKFSVDANGILAVSATDAATGAAQTVVMTGRESVSSAEVAHRIADAEAHAAEDAAFQERVDVLNAVDNAVIQVNTLLRDNTHALSEETQVDLKAALASLEDAKNVANIEIVKQIVIAAKDSIKLASDQVYEWAQAQVPEEKS